MIPTPQLSGVFTVTRSNAAGLVTGEWKFRNMILDAGLDALMGSGLGDSSDLLAGCVLSTNTAAPVAADTSVGGTLLPSSGSNGTVSPIYADTRTVSGTSPYYATILKGFRFATGSSYNPAGTWSTIAIRTAAGTVFCKTRIKDGGGSPTSITVLAGETLDVRYELRWTIPSAQTSGTITINGTPYNYTAQPFDITGAAPRYIGATVGYIAGQGSPRLRLYADTGSIAHGAITGAQPFSGSFETVGGVETSAGSASSYASGSFSRDITWVVPTTATHASGTFRGIAFTLGGGLGSWAILLDANVSKTALQTFTFTARATVARGT